MSEDIIRRFWVALDQPYRGGVSYADLLVAKNEALKNLDHDLSMRSPAAIAKAQEIEAALAAIGGKEAYDAHYDAKLHRMFSSSETAELEAAERLNERLAGASAPNHFGSIRTSVAKTGTGFGERIAVAWRSARESTTGAMGKLKARITRPSAAKAIGEPQALPLVETARGAPLEPMLDGKTHIRLTAEQIPTPEPIKPTNLAAAGKVTSETVRAASAEKLAAAKAAEAQRQIARAERSAEMRTASAEKLAAAKAAEAERVATVPARKAAAIEANAERISSAQAVQAEAAASKAARVASAKATARASFQAPKVTIGQHLSTQSANLGERLLLPFSKLFSTKDPFKILGITPHSSQTATMAAFEAKLAALGDMRATSPRAGHEWQRLHDAYEAVYADLFERPKFTPPAVIVPERTSKIGAAFGRAREATAGIFGKMKGWVKGKPATAIPEASAEAPEVIKLLAGPTAEAAENVAETPNLPILHPTANGKLPPTASGLASGAETSSIKLITGPVYSSAELNGGRRISYLSNAVEHSPLRGKLLLAGGVVAAAAIGYFGNRKQEKYPMPPMPRPRAANWVEATQQPAIMGDIRR